MTFTVLPPKKTQKEQGSDSVSKSGSESESVKMSFKNIVIAGV